MPSDTYRATPVTAPMTVAAPTTGTVRRVSWGAIFAGSAIAGALMIFFATLGIGIGAGVIDPATEADPLQGLATGTGVYSVLTQLVALAVGGYVAARLAGIPRTVTSALHGVTVWAVTTIFIAYAAITGGSALVGAASGIVSSTARGATDAVQAVLPDNFSLPDPAQLAGSIQVADLPEPLQQAFEERGLTPEQVQQEATAAFRGIVSEEQQQAVRDEAQETLQGILASPRTAQDKIAAFFDNLVGGDNAVFNEQDRQQALTQLERRLGITPEEAEQVIQTVQTRTEEAIAEARQTIEQAQQQAVETLDATADAVSNTAFLLAIASILGLLAAAIGAVVGKPSSLIGDRIDDHV